MKVVIVCESMFGNTEVLAEAVRNGLSQSGAVVRLVDVVDVVPGDVHDCDLMVVAAPTHALTLSRPESRAEAIERGADPRRAKVGVREWLGTLEEVFPAAVHRPLVAVFDTRVLKSKHWPGSAAVRAARALRKHGFRVVDRTSFFVDGVTGPLSPGELARSLAWGTALPGTVTRVRGQEQDCEAP